MESGNIGDTAMQKGFPALDAVLVEKMRYGHSMPPAKHDNSYRVEIRRSKY